MNIVCPDSENVFGITANRFATNSTRACGVVSDIICPTSVEFCRATISSMRAELRKSSWGMLATLKGLSPKLKNASFVWGESLAADGSGGLRCSCESLGGSSAKGSAKATFSSTFLLEVCRSRSGYCPLYSQSVFFARQRWHLGSPLSHFRLD